MRKKDKESRASVFFSLSSQDIQKLIPRYTSATAMARAYGCHGGRRKDFNDRLFGLDTSSWQELQFAARSERSRECLTPAMKAHLSVKNIERFRKKFESEILPNLFIEDSPYDSGTARRYIRQWNSHYRWLEYRCECGNDGEWRGKPLSLQLDHRNGRSRDHRLVNLRFLCPNCHAQTETYAGGNKDSARQKRGQDIRLTPELMNPGSRSR